MRLLYVKSELRDLSQGSRIAFVRQLRHLSQDYVSDYLGLTGECKRRSMTRYEKGDRNPKDERVRKIAKLLNVNFNSLKKYDYKNPEDLIYLFFWLEEYIPNYRLDLSQIKNINDSKIKVLINSLLEWKKQKIKRDNHEISYEEYLNWKLNYEIKGERIMKDNLVKINLNDIDSFEGHPFSVNKDDSLKELVHSIKVNGLFNPMIVRKKENGRYEMISGHRRKTALEILGISESEVIVKELNDDEATIFMVDSNMYRETILPSERAFAYKMKMDAMKHQGKTTSDPQGPKLSSEIVEKNLVIHLLMKKFLNYNSV